MSLMRYLFADVLRTHGIPSSRLHIRRDGEPSRGKYVLYWMQASQRERFNPALETAAILANALDLPLLVGVVLLDQYPQAGERHYRFMLEGWKELSGRLSRRGMAFRVEVGDGLSGVLRLAAEATAVVGDRGYTRFQEQWRQGVIASLSAPYLEVEGDVVVPVETVSPKEEYAARTIRPKIHRHLSSHLLPQRRVRLKRSWSAPDLTGSSLTADELLKRLPDSPDLLPRSLLRGGETEANQRLSLFLRQGSEAYVTGRNDPGAGTTSYLSPYLHFGQISPVDIALQVTQAWGAAAAEPLLEQLIVRRELAMNFVYYNEEYDNPGCLPDWVVKTLDRHAADPRGYHYTLEELSEGRTADSAWNAAQLEMVKTGHMAGYMRMYWGKKVLEWSAEWREAYRTLVMLNDTFSLDGRDPNGYAGVAWIFGKHDRPWGEREIFGTIRYMNSRGLARKFDLARYVSSILTEEAHPRSGDEPL